jgi:hypothetical protein
MERTEAAVDSAMDQALRQRWRAMALIIKAKLEAVEAGIRTLEMEFLADTLLPDGRTVGQWSAPQIERSYQTGQMPPALPGLPAGAGHRLLEEGKER